MGGTVGRAMLAVGTMGASEGFGIRPLLEKSTGVSAEKLITGGAQDIANGDLPSPSELVSDRTTTKRKRAALASTLLTGARGVLGEAPVAAASLIGGRKTLG